MFKSWLELTFRHISGTFRCDSTQQRALLCLRVFTKWNKPLMGLICREALHARPLAVHLYTHSPLEMNFGSHEGDDNNCKTYNCSSFPIRFSFFISVFFFSYQLSLSFFLSSLFLSCREGGNVFCSLTPDSLVCLPLLYFCV